MRINFFGGPGSSKSTTAAWLFSELKTRLISVELVTEYVKSWAVENKQIRSFDQVYLAGKQLHYEDRFLSNGIKNIVTDSPTFLSSIYADYYSPESVLGPSLAMIDREYTETYPCFNIYLNRKDKPYVTEGRYQDYEEAKKLDKFIKDSLIQANYKFVEFDYNDRKGILKAVLKNIEK